MNGIHDMLAALKFGGVMMYPLLGLAVLALVLMLDKGYVFWRHGRVPSALRELIETYDCNLADLEQRLPDLGRRNYFGHFFRIILQNRVHPVWWIESRAADEAQVIEKTVGRGLWVLETTVTGAPLLGLLGTIVGMMSAFKLISGGKLVDPTGVTGGVAQALIATAFGLFIALIALFAYNFFSNLQAHTMDEMERLGTRLIDHIRMERHRSEHEREAA